MQNLQMHTSASEDSSNLVTQASKAQHEASAFVMAAVNVVFPKHFHCVDICCAFQNARTSQQEVSAIKFEDVVVRSLWC